MDYVCVLSCFRPVWLCATLWTLARQAPLSMGFSRQECWSGLPCPPLEESSRPKDQTQVSHISYIGRQFLCYSCHLGNLLHETVVQSLSHVWLSATPWTAVHQASCPSPSPGDCSDSYPLNQWCHPTISSSVVPFSSCPQSFPASGSFLKSRLHGITPIFL